MYKTHSEILDEHVQNIKKAREHVPDDSKMAFDNITHTGDVLVGVIRFGEAVKNLIDYFKPEPKEISEYQQQDI